MPIMAMAIDLACNSSYSNHKDACVKALEAGTKQTEIYNYSEKTENYITTRVKDETGNEAVYTITTAGFIYRSYRNKEVSLKLPALGMCDSINTKVGIDSYALTLKWNIGW